MRNCTLSSYNKAQFSEKVPKVFLLSSSASTSIQQKTGSCDSSGSTGKRIEYKGLVHYLQQFAESLVNSQRLLKNVVNNSF